MSNNTDYAVVVGINDYPCYSNLQGPVNDALRFCEWLESTSGGGVPASQIKSILSTDYNGDPKPTIIDIDDAFNELVTLGLNRGGQVGRRLYLFLAGHGLALSLEETALLAANVDSMRLNYYSGTSMFNT